jgi:hypothetical protein
MSDEIRLIMQRIEALPPLAQVVTLALLKELQSLRERVSALEAAAKPKKSPRTKPELVKGEKTTEKKP